MSKIKTFWKLPLRVKFYILIASICLPTFQIVIYFIPLRKILSFLNYSPINEYPGFINKRSAVPDSLNNLVYSIKVVGNHFPILKIKCLAKALSCLFIADKHSKKYLTLHLGVLISNKMIKAHAWINYRQHSILGEEIKNSYNQVACFAQSETSKSTTLD